MKKYYVNNFVRALPLAMAAFLLVGNALTLSTWGQQTDLTEKATLGAGYKPALVDERLRISRLDADGALAQAGAKVGDMIAFVHPGTNLREPLSPTETVAATLYSEGLRIQELELFAASLRTEQAQLQRDLSAAQREAGDLRVGNVDLREANTALRALAGIA